MKKIGGMDFCDVNVSCIGNDSFEECYVSVPEQGDGKIIPADLIGAFSLIFYTTPQEAVYKALGVE
jgi:predicted ATP-dependent Lon-type protease